VTHVATIVAVVLFTIGLWAFGVIAVANRIVATSRHATTIIRDPTIGDDVKERETQRSSLALLRDFVSIFVRGLGVLALSLSPIVVFDLAGLLSWQEGLDALASWEAILIATVVMVAAWAAQRKRRSKV
jgi:hypothetical protein